MSKKAVQSTHCTSCNQPAYTNVIMVYAVKCSKVLTDRERERREKEREREREREREGRREKER